MIGIYAALLSLTEIGIGSTLHAFHIPFTGFFLSLNQIALLSHTKGTKTAPIEISTIAAILKTLSPVGKKLTPMLALTMQGLLFGLGNVIGGRILGALLASLWGFIQPVLILTIIFGDNLWIALSKATDQILPLVLFAITIKCLLAVSIAIYAPRIPLRLFERFIRPLSPPQKTTNNIFLGALRDLFKPLFLLSLTFVIVVFYFMDVSQEVLLWTIFRPLASGYLFFILMRILPLDKLVGFIEKRGETRFTRSLKEAISIIQESQPHLQEQLNQHSAECSSDQT